MEPCTFQPRLKISYTSGNENPEKMSYISGNRNPETVIYISGSNFACSKIKNLLYFSL